MKKIIKKKKHSKKEHQQDPARNDQFDNEKNRASIKLHEQKLDHGHYYGKKWFPE